MPGDEAYVGLLVRTDPTCEGRRTGPKAQLLKLVARDLS